MNECTAPKGDGNHAANAVPDAICPTCSANAAKSTWKNVALLLIYSHFKLKTSSNFN